jgi:pimeloyl-ACP methyl ester carboxylesterase
VRSSAKTTSVTYNAIDIDGLKIAYREAGTLGKPKVVLLHGFPSSSHQYRDLIRALSDRFHVIAPDYQGFGNSDAPDPGAYAYSFDNLAVMMEKFLSAKGFERYGLYVQDYGGPVGFRIVGRRPEALEWLVVCALSKVHKFSGCNPHPATLAPAGSTWSGPGGDKWPEALQENPSVRREAQRAGRNGSEHRAGLENVDAEAHSPQ